MRKRFPIILIIPVLCIFSFLSSVQIISAQEKILFTSGRSGDVEVYVMDTDGTNQVNVTNSPGSAEYDAEFSRDGSKIVYVSGFGASSEIYVMESDGSGKNRLTNNAFLDLNPTFSPDGNQIAFASNRNGNFEVYVMNTDGSEPVNLTEHPNSDLQPAFSPDGSRIVFATNRHDPIGPDFNVEIYVMNADGSGQTRLTDFERNDENPSFSPDGTRIVFTSYRPLAADIYVMDDDGTNLVRLTDNGSASDNNAVFSPDGSKIAFSSNYEAIQGIWVINPDGTGLMRLTGNDEAQPFWTGSGGINQAPVAQCQNVEVTLAPGMTTAEANIDFGSYDPDSDPLTFAQDPAGPYGIGEREVELTVDDGNGGNASCTATVAVRYGFSEFLEPIDNDEINYAKAGGAIPIKFSLGGDRGLSIFAPGYPASVPINCEDGGDNGDELPTETAGGSSLSYDADADLYKYIWKTSRNWSGTCRRLVVMFDDGSVHTADFQFK